ncbi:MAG: serine hydrolase [Marinilabiliaceae bacterium]|nr:serine hydrolase [Marinilabiliaceae bacterium]
MRLFLSFIVWIMPVLAAFGQIHSTDSDHLPVADSSAQSSELDQWYDVISKLVLLRNEHSMIPFRDLSGKTTVAVAFNDVLEWRKFLWRYQQITVFPADQVVGDSISEKLMEADRLIIVLDDLRQITRDSLCEVWFRKLNETKKCCVIFTGHTQNMDQLTELKEVESLIITQENGSLSRDLATQLIFGAIHSSGKLVADINNNWRKGDGIEVASIGRLSYSIPEVAGMNHDSIESKIDSIVNFALKEKAFPGCRVLVSVKGNVIFNKCYGFHSYESIQHVQEHDIYDLASVTKIIGPLPLIMKARDDRLLDLDQPFATYWKDWQKSFIKRSNKEKITVREVLTHQAGLQPYIKYYPLTLKNGSFHLKWYRLTSDSKHTLQIGDHLYLADKFKKVIYQKIRKSSVTEDKTYKYSGLSFMIYPELIEQLYNQDYQQLLIHNFYKPLGASSLVYNPLQKLPYNRIIPTELDTNYRHQQIHGFVHDEAAAVMGGVSGNAGLFGSVHDVAKMMQMYLQFGQYGGKRYIEEQTLREFSRVQYPENNNRRGIGFDKPLFGNDTLSIEKSYPAPGVSSSSFGHSGFTGTFVWMDPEYELMYIFLSNRVYPTRNNPKIYRLNIRPSIQQVFYDALPKKN